MLAPYDVLRLKQHLKMTSDEFLKAYTVPWEIDGDGIIGVKLKTNEDKHCLLIMGDNKLAEKAEAAKKVQEK